jgi:hypothetical protein
MILFSLSFGLGPTKVCMPFGMHHKRTLKSMYTHAKVCMPIRSSGLTQSKIVQILGTQRAFIVSFEPSSVLYHCMTIIGVTACQSPANTAREVETSAKVKIICFERWICSSRIDCFPRFGFVIPCSVISNTSVLRCGLFLSQCHSIIYIFT